MRCARLLFTGFTIGNAFLYGIIDTDFLVIIGAIMALILNLLEIESYWRKAKEACE